MRGGQVDGGQAGGAALVAVYLRDGQDVGQTPPLWLRLHHKAVGLAVGLQGQGHGLAVPYAQRFHVCALELHRVPAVLLAQRLHDRRRRRLRGARPQLHRVAAGRQRGQLCGLGLG